MKLNKTNVDAIPLAESGQKIYRDSDLIGFAVRATTKSKVFIVERRSEGKLYRITIGKTNEFSVAEARKQAQVLLAEIATGKYKAKNEIPKSNPTFQEAFELYLKHKKLKQLSINTYNHCFQSFLFDWKDKDIFEITKDEVFDKFLKLSKYSQSQANLALKMFGSIWTFAKIHYSTEHNQILKTNPVDIIPAKRGWNKIKPRSRHLDEDQIPIFYKAVMEYRGEDSLRVTEFTNSTRDLVLCVMFTGCRRDEGQTLKWSEVDIEKGTFVFTDPKNGDDHLLPMGDQLWAILKERYKNRKGDYVFAGYSRKGNGGGYISTPNGVLDYVERETGIKISLHDLRRTFATICNNLDYGQYTIKRLLNHRSGARDDVTGNYVQVSIKKLRKAMNDIEAVYRGELNPFD
ncbi:tyrosine-type recombinase/integrase [Acinetobacter sp. ABJ_C1_1]|uniref:tyrosine-type recombinase/integrase n=1 Tax=Acinetobacter sp. ABJ_C1_1 TaxID=3378321 RepID=UPI0037DD5EFC